MYSIDRFRVRCFLAGLAALFVVALPLQAQEEGGDPPEEDEYEWEDWTLDSLDQEDFEDIERDGGNKIIHISRGVLPTPSPGASIEIVAPFLYNGVHDRATDLRTTAFVPTTEPFGWHDPYNCGFFEYLIDDLALSEYFGGCQEREILKSNSNEPVEDGYPQRGFAEVGLRLSYHLPFPAIIQADGRYRHATGLLFSEDTSRAYLSYDGAMVPFREISVYTYDSYSLSGAVGLQIPIYGAFATTDIATIGSYYYLYGGLAADYALSNRGVQYSQIADAKDVIRYGNQQDTAVQSRRNNPDGFNRLRTSIEGAIGWRVLGEIITFGLEAYLSAPTTSLLEDGEWRQYYGGMRFYLGYLWGTGATWR